MDSLKSPRFWLAIAGLVSVSVLAVLKVFESDVAAGLLGGLLFGVGMTAPASKDGVKKNGPLAGIATAGIGGALLSGCSMVGYSLFSAAAAAVAVCAALFSFLAFRAVQHAQRRDRIRREVARSKFRKLAERAKGAGTVAIMCIALLSSGCMTSDDGGKTLDPVKAARAASLACSWHGVASGAAMAVCQSLPTAAARDKCTKYAEAAGKAGASAVGLAAGILGAVCPVR